MRTWDVWLWNPRIKYNRWSPLWFVAFVCCVFEWQIKRKPDAVELLIKSEQKKKRKKSNAHKNIHTYTYTIHACYNFDQAMFDGQTSLTKDNFYQWMCAVIRSTLWISIEYVELKIEEIFWMNTDYRRSNSKSVYPFKVTLFMCFRFNFFFLLDFGSCVSALACIVLVHMRICVCVCVRCQSVCFSSLFFCILGTFSL